MAVDVANVWLLHPYSPLHSSAFQSLVVTRGEPEGNVLVDAELGVRAVPDELVGAVELRAGVHEPLLPLHALAVVHALVALDAQHTCQQDTPFE